MSDERLRSIDEQGRRLSNAFESAAAQQQNGRPRRRRWSVVVASVAALAVGILILAGVFRGGVGSTLSLDDAVAAVGKAAFDAPIAQPGKTVYSHSRITGASFGFSRGIGTFSAERRFDTESWYSGGSKGWYRWTMYPLEFPSEHDRTIYRKVTGYSRGARRLQRREMRKHVIVCRTVLAARDASPMSAAPRLHLPTGTQIPTDPDAVYKLLRDQTRGRYVGVGGPAQGIWTTIEGALRGGGLKLSPAQRSAVAQAIGKVPGVRTLGRVEDPNGVLTFGFERTYDSGRLRSRVYFDAGTAVTTYSEETVLKRQSIGSMTNPRPPSYPGVPAGTAVSKYELLDYRYLESAPELQITHTPMAREYCPELRHSRK